MKLFSGGSGRFTSFSSKCSILGASLFLAVFASQAFSQARFESVRSGAWSSDTSWVRVAGTDANGVPDADDTVCVKAGHIITVGSTAQDCASLVVDAGGSVNLTAAGNLRVNGNPGYAHIDGTLSISGSGTLKKQGGGTRSLAVGNGALVTITGSAGMPVFDTNTFDPHSTIEFARNGDQTIASGISFGNLTLGGSGKKTVAPIPSDTSFTCNGKLSIASGVYFDVSTNILHISLKGIVENYGTIDASVGVAVLNMSGPRWINNGTYLSSTTSGFGFTPTTTFTNTSIEGTPVAQTFYNLTVQGSTSSSSNLVVTQTFLIDNGATFNASTGSHEFSGNWINNGTFQCGTSTVTLADTVARSIGPCSFYSLVIDNPKGITLSGDVSVSGGSLTLAAGNVSTGNFVLSIQTPNPGAMTCGMNSVTGTVQRTFAPGSTGRYLFFGTNAFVTPGGIDNPSTMTISAHPSANPPNLAAGADTGKIVRRYYSVSADNAGPSFTYTIRLPYNSQEVRGDETLYGLWCNNGAGWILLGSSASDTAANYVEQGPVMGFGDLTLAQSDAALPIQLLFFRAQLSLTGSDIVLKWETASEVNNLGFYVQRANDFNGPFNDIQESFQKGHGTTVEAHQYTWADAALQPGKYYYRLKQVDLDGTTTFSEVVMAQVSSTTSVGNKQVARVFSLDQNYPNPFNPSTTITFSVENAAGTKLTVYNLLGQEVAVLFDGFAQAGQLYTLHFDASGLTNGAYFYRLSSGNKVLLRKMVLLK